MFHLTGNTTCKVIFMTKQEYRLIGGLAWVLLNEAHISYLPVEISSIAKLYNIELDNSKSRYDNAITLSKNLLKIYICNYDDEMSKLLAIRILSPMIVLKELNIKSAEDISKSCEIPLKIANQRFRQYQKLLNKNSFGHLEERILSNFQDWISSNT